jgi:hypothetical protein
VVPKDWMDIAQLVSSTAAACGLFLTFWQIRRTGGIADLQALQKFFDTVNEREAALARAGNDGATQRHAFTELLNVLEVYASAHNKNLFGRGSEEMVRHKLEDAYIELEAAEPWHHLIVEAVDRSLTFAEFLKFIRRHKKEIDARRLEQAAHRKRH